MGQGRIATFYSYKGGVGRSFLLSNSAVLLARWGYRVLCIDWDLEAPGLHYYFRPYMDVPATGLTDMAIAVREGERVGPLDHITPVTLADGATLDLIAAGGVGNDYVPKLQSIDWEQLYLEHDFGNVLEGWRERWLDSYDVILVDSRTGISDSGGICTAQLPHILAYTFTANQQNVDGVLDVVRRASVTRNTLPYDRSRLLTLPLLCRFDMSEEYERAAEWREKLRGELKSSYDAWVPDGSPVERVLDNCTVPYSAYWSFGEDLPVVTEDFRNPQLISHSIASIAALIARNLEDARLFTESRDAYVDAAIRTGRRGGHYQYDFFISSTSKTDGEARKLGALLAAEGLSSFSTAVDVRPDSGPRESLRPIIDTCRHLILLARDSVSPWHRDELNYFLRQTLDEQSDRTVFPIVGSPRVLRELPALVQSLPAYGLGEEQLAEAVGAIAARVRSDVPHVRFGAAPPSGRRVFVSHAPVDRSWADWVTWTLLDAGYEVDQNWPGRLGDSLSATLLALPDQYRVVVLYSSASFGEGGQNGNEYLLQVPEKFVPVRVDGTEMPHLLQQHGFTDLFGMTAQEAREALLRAVADPGATPTTPPAFPAAFPSRPSDTAAPNQPIAWNVPPRNAGFVGRHELLSEIEARLVDTPTRPLVLTGPCGVGKTQLAIEYAHRYSGTYDVTWYMTPEEPWERSLAELAVALGCARPDVSFRMAVQALNQELRRLPRWLLIFDHIGNPADLTGYLPSAQGHVLITSRNPHWHQIATTLDVGVLSRADAATLLTSRSRNLNMPGVRKLADALDQLPLALVQAAEALYVFPPDQYLQLLQEHPAEALHDDGPADYHGSLSSQLSKSMRRLAQQNPEAAALVRSCSLLAHEPLPLNTLALRSFRRLLIVVERVGLARVSGGALQMPRLTQAVLRDQLTPEEYKRAAKDASQLLDTLAPDPDDPGALPRWLDLMPHFLAIAPTDLVTPGARYAALEACWYLMHVGDLDQALRRLETLYAAWMQILDDDAEETLRAATYLAHAYAGTGIHESARQLDAELYERWKQLLGTDHPDTLRTATNLAVDLAALGRIEEAVELGDRTLRRQHAALGSDHPDTLRTANNLAIDRAQGSDAQHTVEGTKVRLPPPGAPKLPQP